MAEEKALSPNEVKLSDGRIVRLREQKGSDEMIVAGELGGILKAGDQSGSIILSSALAVKTIISIDDKPLAPIRGYEALRDFLDGFKYKDWNAIRMRYLELNGLIEGSEGNGQQ